MPVLGRDDERAGVECLPDGGVDGGHDPVATGHREASGGIGEVILQVDDHESGAFVVSDHGPRW
jgi:hypothetical protein